MNARVTKTGRALLGMLAGATMAMLAGTASAVPTATLVAGSSCPGGSSSATYTPGGASQLVTLCVTTDVNLCGGSYFLQSAVVGEDGRFAVTARSLLASMPDPNTPSLPTSGSFAPVSIVNAGTADLGGTASGATPQAPATNLAVATFTIDPQASATNSSYTISLLSSLVTSTSSNCSNPLDFADNSIAASFTFNQAAAPPPPTVTISASPASLFDAAGNVSTVTVTLSAAAPAGGLVINLTPPALNPRYSTTCGTTLTVAAGNTTATCTVTATPNTDVGDGSATASVTINANAAYTISGTNPVMVTIQDNDIPIVSAVCTPSTLTDSAGQVSTCTISSDKALVAPLTVNLNPPAVDARYSTTCAGTIIIPAGAAGTSNTCTITAVANTALGDGNVTASLSVAAGTGYTVGGSTQNVAVNNDDVATISVSVAPGTVVENSGTPLVFTFTAGAASPTATSVLITPPAASSRYSTTCTSPITIAANATTATCTVTPVDNGLGDGSVSATVTVLPSAGNYVVGTASATGTITDDEVGVGVAAGSSVTEGGVATFTLSCTGTGSATVNYSFSGSYTPLPAANSAVLTCGTPVQITVPTIDDSLANGTRTLTLTINSLTNVTGSLIISAVNSSGSVQIIDNDRPTVIPTMSPLGMMLMALFLAGVAGFGIRRKV